MRGCPASVDGWPAPGSRSWQSSTIDFALCLGATATEKLAGRTKSKSASVHPLEKKDEVVANVIWRFLELRGCAAERTFLPARR